MDNLWVWTCDQDCNLNVNPATHVRNGFIQFCCNELTNTFTSMTRASFLSIPSSERTNGDFFIDFVNDYRDYPYSFYPNKPQPYPLAQTCRYLRQRCLFWLQLWRQSVVTIIPERVNHLMYPIYHSPDLYLTMILYIPDGWEVCRICR